MKITLSLIIILVFVISFVSANGVGNSIKKEVNGYYFEFGIEPKEPKINEKTIMSLSLHQISDSQPVAVDDLWVRISKGDKIFFTSTDFRIKKDGPIFITYAFNEPGKYIVDFSAKHNNIDIKTDFKIKIRYNITELLMNVLFLIMAFIFGYTLAKKQS